MLHGTTKRNNTQSVTLPAMGLHVDSTARVLHCCSEQVSGAGGSRQHSSTDQSDHDGEDKDERK